LVDGWLADNWLMVDCLVAGSLAVNWLAPLLLAGCWLAAGCLLAGCWLEAGLPLCWLLAEWLLAWLLGCMVSAKHMKLSIYPLSGGSLFQAEVESMHRVAKKSITPVQT
jgi:hypothetical protein